MIVSLPFFEQQKEYSCGPASLKMVMSFFGNPVTESVLSKKIKTNHTNGTAHQPMIDFAVREGFYCYVNSRSSLHEIKHFLSLGLPIIVDFTEPSEDQGHYAVVVGIKRNNVILNDPWNGKHFKMSERKFTARWHDSLTKSNGWLMVISKEDLKLGKQYLPLT